MMYVYWTVKVYMIAW